VRTAFAWFRSISVRFINGSVFAKRPRGVPRLYSEDFCGFLKRLLISTLQTMTSPKVKVGGEIARGA